MKPHPSALTGDMLIPLAQKLKASLETVTALIHCRDCGSGQDVQIIPYGSLGRLTPLCPDCLTAIQARDKEYWEAYANPSRERERRKILSSQGFFTRLFLRKR